MSSLLKSGCRLMLAGWFWAFVLLALPNCGLPFCDTDCAPPSDCEGSECPPCNPADPDSPCFDVCIAHPENSECIKDPVPEFQQGSSPTDAIMCYLPAPVVAGSECAEQTDVDDPASVSLTEAATALAEDRSNSIALDWSTTSVAACGGIFPKKITFLGGVFPDGLSVCINCGTQIGPSPAPYATTTDACIVKCRDLLNDLINSGGPTPTEGVDAYCAANASTATNYDKTSCDPRFAGACTSGGSPDLNFVDPRRTPEPVMWLNTAGTDDNGGTNTLTRTAATSATPDFDAGATSVQTISTGDAWVEFAAGETGLSHVLSLRDSCSDPVIGCPDSDPGINAIGFAISLNSDGNVYVIESAPGPGLNVIPVADPYAVGERFRVRIVNNHDGTVEIRYSRFYSCTPGPGCTEYVFHTSTETPSYPLVVDTSFREQNATLTNVTLVRIQ